MNNLGIKTLESEVENSRGEARALGLELGIPDPSPTCASHKLGVAASPHFSLSSVK